ncbi:hypothetical protein CAC42_1707 [Sphaceloma murrayae]|uniref:Uncharacterized protein n=1 Tax=Sphaceloma murrayae TaxID=2082308 RepID=A0A2K1QHQ1_9PEZI|nr:hypothetical protein CAC42_1707 [Sphaceloma murrayae]
MRSMFRGASAARSLLVLLVVVFLVYNSFGGESKWSSEAGEGRKAMPPVRPGWRAGGEQEGRHIARPGGKVGSGESTEVGEDLGRADGTVGVDEDHDDTDRPIPSRGDEKVLKEGKLSRVSYEEYARLDPEHFPGWSDYYDKDYDPNRWHFFDVETDLFTSEVKGEGEDRSREEVAVGAEVDGGKACVGPRGQLMGEDPEDEIHGYDFDPTKFPDPIFGSYEAMGLNDSICYDRLSRMRAYGLGDSEDPARELEKGEIPKASDWGNVDWGSLQKKCLADNIGRFKVKPNAGIDKKDFLENDDMKKGVRTEPGKISRTAVLLRTWEQYKYEWNDIHSIRALITELGLAGRGEYEVFILLHVKDKTINFRGSEEAARRTIEENIPPEFRDMTILFNEDDLKKLYPAIGSNDVYQHQFQPVQYFAIHHPEYDYIWNWEMDARYIGHHYNFLKTVTSFAQAQPRLYLWERSTRYFLPSIHKTWSRFTSYITRVIPPQLTTWGPVPSLFAPLAPILAPGPVTDPETTNWGINEPADFITFLPLFDPQNTLWAPRDRTFNYPQHLTTPRRAFINTLTRVSTRLLHAMHLENKAGRAMVSEMWPSSVALHYGLKVVYAPHPIFSTRKWDKDYAEKIFNPGPEVAPGTGTDSVYAVDREHNFGGMSWYYDGGAAGTIYRKWLGWGVKGPEGKETVGEVKDQWEGIKGREEGREERLCLPPMLLHPVKNVEFDKRGQWNGKEM